MRQKSEFNILSDRFTIIVHFNLKKVKIAAVWRNIKTQVFVIKTILFVLHRPSVYFHRLFDKLPLLPEQKPLCVLCDLTGRNTEGVETGEEEICR